MKKTSKILSLLVALCMTVTMLSGLTVMAEDTLELVSYDADADFITLDFNQEIDTVNSTIVLKKDGEFVDFTIAKNDFYDYTQSTLSSRYTYLVTPEDGVELDAEYKISFWDVKSSDGASTLAQSAMTFTVAEIGDYDNFEITKPYQYRNVAFTLDDDNEALKLDEYSGKGYSTATVGALNNSNYITAGALVGKDVTAGNILPYYGEDGTVSDSGNNYGSGGWQESDYTMKLTYKADTRVGSERIVFGLSRGGDQRTTYRASDTFIDGTLFAMDRYSTLTPTAAGFRCQIFDRDTDATSVTRRRTTGNTNYIKNIDVTTGVDLKFSIKDSVARAFVNGKKLMDSETYGIKGFPSISFILLTFDAEYTAADVEFSNLQVTQSTFASAAELDTPEGYVVPEPEEEEYPEMILDWDADLDVFTVDFEEEIASLDATITQAGTIIPASVYFANYNDDASTSRYTWIVEPTGGFVRDIPYTVTIANVSNADGSKTISTWSKTFKVEVLAEGLQDVTTGANDSSVNATFTHDGDDLIVSATGNSDAVTDNLHVFKALDSGSYESDYTIKVTLKDFVNVGYAQGFFGITSTSALNYGYDHPSLRGVVSYAKIGASATNDTVYSNIYWNTSGTANKVGTGSFSTIDFRDAENPVPIELKLAVKNQNASTYWNGLKTNDTTVDATVSGRPQLAINLRDVPDTTVASVTYTDFIATRAIHLDVTGESFVVDEAIVEEGAIADNETVTISTVLTNNTLVDKAIFAACALYDAAGAMKNFVISTVGSATSGETPLEFEDVVTNGATYAKIFIWDSASALNPWFPAIEVE